MIDFGIVKPGTTLYIPFSSYAGSTGASVTLTGLATTDIEIYKDGSVTQRASDAGYALLDTDGIDFDGITGVHGFSIDLADNTTAGFYAAGSQYWVVVSTVTIDSQTVTFIAATFRIGYPDAILNTTIATLSSQTSFTLTAGPAEDDALNNCQIVIHDVASAVQVGRAVISDYTGSTKTVTLAAGTTFTAAASDNVSVLGLAPLIPTVAGRTLDCSTGGEAGLDWANVGSPTTTLALTGTTIATTQKVDVETIKTNPVVNGGTITFPTGATLASTTNITAGTVTTATNVTTVNGLAANVITAASMAADASAEIADAVWDEDATAHQTQGTFGQAIGDPGADTDTIWGLANTNLDAAVSSRMATYTQPTGFLTATFPTTVASTTNITAGTITTATNVTTVNGLAAGVITATSIASDALTAAKFAADVATEIRSLASGTSDSGTTTTMVDSARTEADTDYWKGQWIVFTSGNIAGQARLITAFTPGTDTITFSPATTQAVTTQTYEIWPAARVDLELIRGTVSQGTPGYAGLDWGSITNQSATVSFDDTTLNAVNVVNNVNTNAITSASFSSNSITAASLAADAGTELGTAVWASATRTLTAATNITTAIVNAVWDEAQSGHTSAGTFGKYLDAQVSTVGGGTAAQIADAVWDELLSGHLTAGSTGAALNAAGSAGDPWTTTLPGSYTGSQAGFKFGTLFATALNILHPYVGQDSSLELVIGDDYYAADNRNIQFTYGASPSLSGATVYLDIQTDKDEAFEGTNITSTSGSASGTTTQTVTFDLPGTTTDDFDEGWRAYRVRAVLSNSHTVTLTRGRLNMLQRGDDAP